MAFYKFPIRWLFVFLVFAETGCQKNKDATDTNPDGTDSSSVKIEGTIYWKYGSKIRSLNLKTNAFIESPTIKYPGSSFNYTPLAYDSGFLYTGNTFGATCVNASTGAIAWETAYSSSNYNSSSTILKNSVVISGSLIYIVGYTGASGQRCLYAIDKATGAIKWSKTTTGIHDFSLLTTPVINGEQIIVAANNDGSFGSDLNRLICLNKNTGGVIWDKTFKARLGSWLVVNNNILYLKTIDSARVIAINTIDGAQKWKTDFVTANADDKLLCADNDLVVHMGSNNPASNYYYYLDYNTGAIKGSFSENNLFFGSWVKTDLNYIAAAGLKLTAFDSKTHAVQWKVQAQHVLDQDTIPAAVSWGVTDLVHYNDYVLQFAIWTNPNLPVEDRVRIKTIYVTDIKNGKTVQRIPLAKDIPVSNPAFGFILVNQNKVYYTHYSGNVKG